MRNKDKRAQTRIRNSKGYGSASASATQNRFTKKKLSVVAVSVALSLGLGFQAIAATETTPFSKESLGVTATTNTSSTGTTTTATAGSSTTQNTTTTAGLIESNSTNLGSANAPVDFSVVPFNPSAAVLTNAQSCAEDMKEIREENLVRDIEMADAGFNVDTFFSEVRDSGCLVSVQDSISLANQITSLSGGSIASMIMSQVESKIIEASNQMMQKVFDKGCEVMLEASQGVYGPINDVVKKYGVYGNPDMVGSTVGGLIDGVVAENMFNFDSKLDEIGDKILAKNQSSGSSGSSDGGSLLPPATGGMGETTGSTNISDAEKAAAQSTVEDLAASRNNLSYPYYETRREVWKTDARTGNRYLYETYADISMHTLKTSSPKGTLINSIQNGTVSNDSNAVCVYIAQITSINNEIIRIVNEKGVENTTADQVQPMNLSPAYWSAANQYINTNATNSSTCAQEAVELTTPTTVQETGSSVSSASAVSSTPTTNSTINYGASSSVFPITNKSVAPTTSTSTSTAPSTNEATQYMQSKEPSSAAALTEQAESSNPFSKMKNIFN